MQILIKWDKDQIKAELFSTSDSEKIFSLLPIESKAETWGDEVYFTIPDVDISLSSDATDVVEPGTICFWVQGNSIAIPFGPTPASRGSECRLVTAVNILGRILDDPKKLLSIRAGDTIKLIAYTE